jgi:hypothetical protein
MDFQTPVLLFTSAARSVNFLNFASFEDSAAYTLKHLYYHRSTSSLIFLIIYSSVDQFNNKVKNKAYKIADQLGSALLVKYRPTVTALPRVKCFG